MKGIILLVIYWFACFECANNGVGRRKTYVPVSNQIQYLLEITNFSISKSVLNLTYDMSNVQWINGEYVRYYSIWWELFRPIHLAKMNFRASRCENIRYRCEHFLTIKINDTSPYCSLLQQSEYGLVSYVQKITPKGWMKNCPRFEKGMYKLENATAGDITKVAIAIYSEIPKYYWQFDAVIRDPKNAVLATGHLEAHLTAYVKRRKN